MGKNHIRILDPNAKFMRMHYFLSLSLLNIKEEKSNISNAFDAHNYQSFIIVILCFVSGDCPVIFPISNIFVFCLSENRIASNEK